jgi:hypothetical protein
MRILEVEFEIFGEPFEGGPDWHWWNEAYDGKRFGGYKNIWNAFFAMLHWILYHYLGSRGLVGG